MSHSDSSTTPPTFADFPALSDAPAPGDSVVPDNVEEARQTDYIAFLFRTPFALDAYELGFATGLREDYTLQQDDLPNLNVPVYMMDNDFHDPDIDRWVEIFERYRPKVGVLGDAYTREEAREYVDVATKLKRQFPDAEIMVVPKCDCFDILPDWMLLGYSAGGENDEGQADKSPSDFSTVSDWRGRRVHILGAAPQKQWKVVKKLTQPTHLGEPPADIIGLDWNGAYRTAQRYFKYWQRKKANNATSHYDRDQSYDSHREVVAHSLREMKKYYQERGLWPETTPIEEYGPAVLSPDDPVFASDGSHIDFDEEMLHEGRATSRTSIWEEEEYAETDMVIVEYTDGTTIAYRSETQRAFCEYRAGVLREHGDPKYTFDTLQQRRCVDKSYLDRNQDQTNRDRASQRARSQAP